MVRRVVGVVAGVGLLGAGLACGPSFQVIYEGNARFEHCYALEEQPQTLVPEKADCWRDWSEHYTFGQTRDRIHYATARYVALSSNVPTDEAMMMAAPGVTPRQSTITAPAPTNAFAPPPKVLDESDAGGRARPSDLPAVIGDAGGSNAPNTAPMPVLPAADCGEGCGKKFRECKDACRSSSDARDAGGGGKDAACAACEKTYRGCMRGCFK